MCRRKAKGRRFKMCGHFLRLEVTHIVDCGDLQCEQSIKHPKSCTRRTCTRDFGPDIEKDVQVLQQYCWPCTYAQQQAAGIQPA